MGDKPKETWTAESLAEHQGELRRRLDVDVVKELGTDQCPRCLTPLHHDDVTARSFQGGMVWWAQVHCPKREKSSDEHYIRESPVVHLG